MFAHSMGGMADGAGEPCVNVQRMLAKACIGENICKVMTLGTKRIRSSGGRIDNGRQEVLDGSSRPRGGCKTRCHLAEFIAPFKDMRELRSVRTIRSTAAKLAIVVAVVAVRAENAGTHRPTLRMPVQVQHGLEQTGLR